MFGNVTAHEGLHVTGHPSLFDQDFRRELLEKRRPVFGHRALPHLLLGRKM